MTASDTPSRSAIVFVAIAVFAVAGLAGSLVLRLAPSSTEFTLPAMEADVAQRFPIVTHLPRTDFKAKLASGNPPLLVDVREDAEFNVSHLAGAIHMRPDVPIAEAKATLQPLAAGRDVVFYCASGMRSSVLATEVQDELTKSGATGVYNLQGGIFGWHNDNGALVDAQGATDVVHPVSDTWGTLLVRQDKLRMTPQSSPSQ